MAEMRLVVAGAGGGVGRTPGKTERERGGEGKRGDFRGGRIIKKKKKKPRRRLRCNDCNEIGRYPRVTCGEQSGRPGRRDPTGPLCDNPTCSCHSALTGPKPERWT